MWDTETSYGDRRPGTNIRVYTGKQAATYVARTYIDSMRYGVPRVFWYGWEVDILGLDLTVNGQRTQAGDAYLTVSRWMSGAQWKGCKRSGRVTTCKMVRDGSRYEIKYASKRTQDQVAVRHQVVGVPRRGHPQGPGRQADHADHRTDPGPALTGSS